MSDLLSRLESRIRQAVEKIEEYQLEIDELKERNTVLEAERQEMHDKLALLIDSFEELEAAADDDSDSPADVTEEVAETVEAAEEETSEEVEAADVESSDDDHQEVDVSHHNSHNSVNSYAASPW